MRTIEAALGFRKGRWSQSVGLALVLALGLSAGACGRAVDGDEIESVSGALSRTASKAGLLDDEPIFFLRGTVSSFGSTPVTLSNGNLIRVDLAAATSLAKHREIAQQIGLAGAALFGAPDTTEEFFETDTTVGLSATTHFVVADDAAFQTLAPLVTMPRPKPGASFASLSPAQRAWFQQFRANMAGKPAGHPLAGPARKGDAALWAAVLAGKGDVKLTTKVEVPIGGLTRTGNQVLAPAVVNGTFDYAQQSAQIIHGVAAGATTFEDSADGEDGPAAGGGGDVGIDGTWASGSAKTETQFVNGYIVADAFDHTFRWDFSIGHVLVTGGAWYGFGLRIPIVVSGTIAPSTIAHTGNSPDEKSAYTTDVSVKVLDGDSDFYAAAGLPPEELYDGHELVLTAGAFVRIQASLAGVVNVDQTIPAGGGVDFGQDFTPPFANCGTDCGLDFWIPSEVTHTGIDLLGIVRGEARIGFNVAGDGHVDVDYESLDDGEVVVSDGSDGTHKTHRPSFSGTATKTYDTTLAKLSAPGSKNYGYKLSNVDYTWDVALTPGVRGDISVDTLFWSWGATIGPFWVDDARIGLGSLHLGTLEGTRKSQKVSKGRKSWTIVTASQDTGAVDRAKDATSATEIDLPPSDGDDGLDMEACSLLRNCGPGGGARRVRRRRHRSPALITQGRNRGDGMTVNSCAAVPPS